MYTLNISSDFTVRARFALLSQICRRSCAHCSYVIMPTPPLLLEWCRRSDVALLAGLASSCVAHAEAMVLHWNYVTTTTTTWILVETKQSWASGNSGFSKTTPSPLSGLLLLLPYCGNIAGFLPILLGVFACGVLYVECKHEAGC